MWALESESAGQRTVSDQGHRAFARPEDLRSFGKTEGSGNRS